MEFKSKHATNWKQSTGPTLTIIVSEITRLQQFTPQMLNQLGIFDKVKQLKMWKWYGILAFA
jgi:hypothetical protein